MRLRGKEKRSKNIKICGRCKQKKSLSCFYKDKHSIDKLTNACKSCCDITRKKFLSNNPLWETEQNKKYNLNNFEYIKDYKLRRDHGLTLATYNMMFKKQKGKCAICGTHQSELRMSLAVDHDHKTGVVRDLLCNSCNWVLGHCKEDIAILDLTIKYIKKWSKIGDPK
jgi:hypothetical protein